MVVTRNLPKIYIRSLCVEVAKVESGRFSSFVKSMRNICELLNIDRASIYIYDYLVIMLTIIVILLAEAKRRISRDSMAPSTMNYNYDPFCFANCAHRRTPIDSSIEKRSTPSTSKSIHKRHSYWNLSELVSLEIEVLQTIVLIESVRGGLIKLCQRKLYLHENDDENDE